MPPGLDIIEAVEARVTGFAERLTASCWELRLDGVAPEQAEAAVAAFLAADAVEVRRQTKKGLRSFDARAAVVALTTRNGGPDGPSARPCAILRLVVRHLTPAVRPVAVRSGLRTTADLARPLPAGVTRLAQGPLDEEHGTVTDPFAPDRDAATTPAGAAGLQAAAAP